jgi:MinD-like ATPase involved in chromosome partitioning or flagellar assembly
MKVPVLSAAEGAGWEAGLVTALDQGEHGVEIVRRCVDIVDLLAVAATGQGRAALVAAGLRRLDADAVDRLLAAEVVPVGVMARGDVESEDRLRAMGVEYLVPDDADAAVVASVLVAAITETMEAPPGGAGAMNGARTGGGPTTRTGRTFGDPANSLTRPAGEPIGRPAANPTRQGSVIAVWGPTGAPGRTTVAVTLADELARLGSDAFLVDADVYGGTIAAVLGLLDESPGLAAACRQAGSQRLDAEALAAVAWQVSSRLRVLTGIPLAERWPELRPSAVESVLAAARTLADYTVVDCGFSLETDEELSFDTLAPRRNGATLAVLDSADVVIVVGTADPVGMQRLVRALGEVRTAEIAAPVWVVVNRVRRGVVPGDPSVELVAALDRFAGRHPAALLPLDQDGVDAALAAGRTLGEMRPASPLRRAVVDLAAALVGTPVPAVGSRRKHRAR